MENLWQVTGTECYNYKLLILIVLISAGVQPRQVSGSPKDGQRRQRMQSWTPSLMLENGQPLWVWLNSQSLIKLYFYRNLLYNIKETGTWHDFSSRKGLYRNAKKMYRKFYRFNHAKQRLFWPGGLTIRQPQLTTCTKFQIAVDHLMSNKVYRIWHRSKRYARLVICELLKGPCG